MAVGTLSGAFLPVTQLIKSVTRNFVAQLRLEQKKNPNNGR